MLTVDYDTLGLRPGDLLLDLGCGFGRHAFEGFRRGARVVACDMAARRAARGRRAVRRHGRRRRGLARRARHLRQRRRHLPAVPGRHVRPHHRQRGHGAHPRRPRRPRRADPGAQARRHHGRHHPGLAPREDLLGAERRVPRPVRRGRPRPHLHRERAAREDARRRPRRRRRPPRPRPARAVLVAEVRGRAHQRRLPAGEALQQAAGVGHHEEAGHHPGHRAAAQPGAGQEPRGLRHQADRPGRVLVARGGRADRPSRPTSIDRPSLERETVDASA